MFDPREKIALFIDGANLFAASKSLGFDIDYCKLLEAFRNRAYLLRAYYYTAIIEDLEFSSIRPLIDWLDYNGYTVVTKPAKAYRRPRPTQDQGKHGHRTGNRCHGAIANRRSSRDLFGRW